jgi:tRNA threonylcarbamoyladenosine biosynthesis protein TsaB
MEVYSVLYDRNLEIVRDIQADIVNEQTYQEYLSQGKVAFFGDGSEKCKTVINHANALFIEDIYPLASAMVTLAEEAFEKRAFVDVAYFEPFYLKEFQATVGKNKLLLV